VDEPTRIWPNVGGLTPKAQRLVPPTALRTVERRLRAVELRGGRLPPLLVHEQAVEIAMVQRAAFDPALADAAAVAGADVRHGERVDDVVEEEDRVTVMTRRGRTRVDYVIAADGDPSAMSRHLDLAADARSRSLGLCVEVPLPTHQRADTAVVGGTLGGGLGGFVGWMSGTSFTVGLLFPAWCLAA
jgi:flavin-dependent dehydrogenase